MTTALITHADGTRYLRDGECNGCEGKATCCTYLALPLKRTLSPDEQHWVELHPGVRIEGQSVLINVACSALKDGRCSLFGTPERPDMCGRYPELPDQVIAGCAYSLKEI